MSSPTLSQTIVEQKFGCHRGHNFDFHKQNSLNAIKSAIAQNRSFVEFDVTYQNGNIKTGHPPQDSLDFLKDVLKVFRGSKTFPKVDLKLNQTNDDFTFIDDVIKFIGQCHIPFALLSMSNVWIRHEGVWEKKKNKKKLIQSYRYCTDKIKSCSGIKLSLEIAWLKKHGKKLIAKETKNHIKYLTQNLYCFAIEIHEGDWEETIQMAQEYNIPVIQFWLRGWPDVPHPQVNKSTILKAIDLENHYPIKIYFDINPEYVVE